MTTGERAERSRLSSSLEKLSLAGPGLEPFNPRDLNRKLKAYLRDSSAKTLILQPIENRYCEHASAIFQQYKFAVTVKHSKLHRVFTLTKTEASKVPNDFSKIDRLIAQKTHSAPPAPLKYEALPKKEGPKKTQARPKDGTVVGADAEPIAAGNKGNQLLQRMGWVPGEAIGNPERNGLIAPLTATFRSNKVGIGAK